MADYWSLITRTLGGDFLIASNRRIDGISAIRLAHGSGVFGQCQPEVRAGSDHKL